MQIQFIDVKSHEFQKTDILNKSYSELLEIYPYEGETRLVFKQNLKVIKEPKASIRYMFGSILWMFIILIPSISLFMFIFLFRKKIYFVEHVIFSLYSHSVLFIFLSIALVIPEQVGLISSILSLVYIIWFFISLKRFYNFSVVGTFFRLIIIGFVYFVMASVFSVFSILLRVISM